MEQYNIEDFIGSFDGYFDDVCDRYMQWYKTLQIGGLTYGRSGYGRRPDGTIDTVKSELKHRKNDNSADLISGPYWNRDMPITYVLQDFANVFWKCARLYAEEYSILHDGSSQGIVDIKIQKTCAGEGYHIWHYENGGIQPRNRTLGFMMYLNDGYEGGETEFLYQHRRIQPKKDRLLIWPAGFTHTHRGNMVLKGEKYIITGWVEYIPETEFQSLKK